MLYDLVEEGDATAKDRIKERRSEKESVEKDITILKGQLTESKEMPSMISEVIKLVEWGSKEESAKAFKEFYPKLEAKLADFDTRRKLSVLMPKMLVRLYSIMRRTRLSRTIHRERVLDCSLWIHTRNHKTARIDGQTP